MSLLPDRVSNKTSVIVQARMGSSRLPGKVLSELAGRPMLAFQLERLSNCRAIDEIVLATTDQSSDDQLVAFAESWGITVVRGSEKDVLSRFALVAKTTPASTLVRVTADCPFVDPGLLEHALAEFHRQGVDYLSNCAPPSYPDGLDLEVFTREALLRAQEECVSASQREHVTPWMRESGVLTTGFVQHSVDLSKLRWTVDEPEDLAVIRAVVDALGGRADFTWKEVLALQQLQPQLFSANAMFTRNEGARMGDGQKLWRRAKRVIPGGSMLLSKRAEMFLPDQWPAYFSRAKGCRVWDLDGRELIDMSFMGIGTNSLGYGHPEVDGAVMATVAAGTMSTLNCPEEVWLAERLVALHPWAEMVRFARSGGEANAIAIRIARAATGRTKVAFCGYHGWHDWYLAANLGDQNSLAGHLLPGLEPKGVAENLLDTIYPFTYNRFEELEAVVRDHDIGVIIMEVSRNEKPRDKFLERIRSLATQKGIVLIFDECTSGFRESLGGLHMVYGVEPDMAIFGKALGNGYAITAIIGRREVMEAAQASFISSTFWTERIGPTAALKTLEVMERIRSYDQITRTGEHIASSWRSLAQRHGLKVSVSGLSAMPSFNFSGSKALAYKTLIAQEMLVKGYLATTGIYVCTEHTDAIVSDYINALDLVFKLIADCENGRDVGTLLRGPICHGGFKRIN